MVKCKFTCVRSFHLISSPEDLSHVLVVNIITIALSVTNSFTSIHFFSVPTDLALKRPIQNGSICVDIGDSKVRTGSPTNFNFIKFPGLEPL